MAPRRIWEVSTGHSRHQVSTSPPPPLHLSSAHDTPDAAVAAYNKRAKQVGKPLTAGNVLDKNITAALLKQSAAIIAGLATSKSSSGAGSGSRGSSAKASGAKASGSSGNSSTMVSSNTQAATKSRCEPQTARQMLGGMPALATGQASEDEGSRVVVCMCVCVSF